MMVDKSKSYKHFALSVFNLIDKGSELMLQ